MTQKSEILLKLTPLCRKAFANPELDVCEDLDASRVSTWTSLSFMHLLTDVEIFFGFKFKMIELLYIHNIGDLVKVIESHQRNLTNE